MTSVPSPFQPQVPQPPMTPPNAPTALRSAVSQSRGAIPDFEGATVSSAASRVTGSVTIDTDPDLTVGIDDILRLVGEYRVIGVSFKVDKNGDTVREHLLKAVQVSLTPFDPSDPTDDGVVRARGRRP